MLIFFRLLFRFANAAAECNTRLTPFGFNSNFRILRAHDLPSFESLRNKHSLIAVMPTTTTFFLTRCALPVMIDDPE